MIRLTRVQRLLNSNTRATMKSYNSHVVMFGDMPLEHDTVEKSDNVLISDSTSTDHPYDHSIVSLKIYFQT